MSKRDTKKEIVETASRLFYKNGYNLTGINEIIAEAGIAKATLYSHFKSKEDICIAYLQYKNEVFVNDITPYYSTKETGDAQILAFFDFLSNFFDDIDFAGCWCIRTVSEIPQENERIRTEIRNQKNGLIATMQNVIAANKPNLTERETEALAKQVYLLYETAVSESYLHQDKWPIESARSMCQKLLM